MDISTADGFLEITEDLADMIKYVANEPSVGLFYVQQHTQNAVPNILNLRNNLAERSRETNLHTEDTEDSIVMVRSMKECGFPVVDEMIRDIRASLAIMSTKQPKRGLIEKSNSGFPHGRTSSWGPSTWARYGVGDQLDGQRTKNNYFSTVFKSAKEKATNFKWAQLDPKASAPNNIEKLPSCPISSESITTDALPRTFEGTDEQQQGHEEDEHVEKSPLPPLENYDVFKADKEAKLEDWLGGNEDNLDKLQEIK